MHIIIGLIVGFFALIFFFAVLLRPLRWITVIWLALLILTFIPLLVTGASDKMFRTDFGLMDDFAAVWAISALYITPRALGALLVFSLVWRGITALIEEKRSKRRA